MSKQSEGSGDEEEVSLYIADIMFTHSLFLTVHDGLQLLKVPQLDLQLLHLGLHQQGHQGLDLPLFYCRQVLHTQEAKMEEVRRNE